MKCWILKRRDRRHSTLTPSSRRCRARRLVFERCEDRRMLSGSSLTIEFDNGTLVGEGGFLAVNTSGFLLADANNFLFDADSFSQPTTGFGRSRQWHSVGAGQQITVPDFFGTHGDEAASSIALPATEPSFYDFGLSDSLVQEPLLPTIGNGVLLVDGNDVSLDVPADDIDDDLFDEPTNDSPRLSGGNAKMLVIDDPIQIVASQLNTDRHDQREGGTLQVAAVVHTSQRAYELQLSAIIAHNLNRDGVLPTTLPMQTQPVVAELARVVAFETLGQQEVIPKGDIDRVSRGQFREPTQATPLMLEPVSAQLRLTPVRRSSTNNSATDEIETHISKSSRGGEDSMANLAERVVERVDDEQQAAQIITFAQWPTLATVIAGYLLVERRRPQAAQTVQTPPRRQRLVQHKTPAS